MKERIETLLSEGVRLYQIEDRLKANGWAWSFLSKWNRGETKKIDHLNYEHLNIVLTELERERE